MKIYPSQFMAWVLAQELDMDCCNLGDCEIDTEENTITFYGAVAPETATLPKEMEIMELQQSAIYHQHIIVKNSPKHSEAHYMEPVRYEVGIRTPRK